MKTFTKQSLTKRMLAIILSLLFALSSFTIAGFAPMMDTQAATDEVKSINLTVSYVGITAASSGTSRYSASGQTATLNIVNDQQDTNFSIGYVNIDISPYAGREFKNFPLTFGKGADADGDCQGLKFWYTGNKNADSYTTNGRINNDSNVTGTENGHLAKAVSRYALTEIASFTKEQFNAGTMNIDVAAAANATLARGGTRLVIMITQAKSGGKAEAGGWTDTKVTFNKSQACNAVLKAQTTFTGTLSKNGTGVPISGTESRWNTSGHSNQMNIVNDQQPNNTDAGIIRYDISNFSGKSVESAKLNYKVDSWSADTVTTGLTFYYSTSINDEATYVNNGEKQSAGWSCGSGTTANNSFATGLGFSTSNTLGVVSKGSATSSTQMDIKSALQKAIDAGATKFFIIIMQSTAGGSGSTNGWSDTWLTPSNFTIDYTVKEKDRTRTDVANIKKNLTAKTFSNYPYSGNMTSTQDGSYSKSNLTGGDEMLNVLYSYGVGDQSAYRDWGDDNYFQPGFQYGDITLLWDGENKMACPINIYGVRTTATWGSNGASEHRSVYIRGDGYKDNSVAYLDHNWHTGTTPTVVGYKPGVNYNVDIQDGKCDIEDSKIYKNDKNQTAYYSNTIYVDGSKMEFSSSDKRKTVNLYANIRYRGSGTMYSKTAPKSGTNGFDHASIRVINYAPIADAIKKGKEIYNTVSNDENSYCPNDLYNFYEALDKLMSFNPNNYFAYNNNGYAACCEAMEALDPYISPAKSPLTKSNTTYTHSYINGEAKNAQKHAIHCNDCGEDIEEACSFTLTSTVDATCTSTGTNTYTCSKCSGTVTETIPMEEHNWGDWNGTYSSTKHTRQCQDCKKWDEYVECDHNTVIPGKAATCTETGLTDGYACSVCGTTRVAKTTIPVKEHSYTGASMHIEASGDENGYTKYLCVNGCNEYGGEVYDDGTDWRTYDSALEAASNEYDNDYYSAESRKDYKDKIDEIKFGITSGDVTKSQAFIDNKTTAIIEAHDILKQRKQHVTFTYQLKGQSSQIGKTRDVEVNTVEEFNISSKIAELGNVYVQKWVAVETIDGKDIDRIISAPSDIAFYSIHTDTTIICYLSEDVTTPSDEAKITLKDKNNKIIDVKYVPLNSTFSKNGNVLSVGDETLTATKIPYYDVVDFVIEGTRTNVCENGYTVTDDIVIKPVYKVATSSITIGLLSNDITLNNVKYSILNSYKAKWDEKITVSNPDAKVWYAGNKIVAYGTSYTFQASSDVTITYSTEDKNEASSRIDYAQYESEFGYTRVVVSNCVPEGATVVEQGILALTSSKVGATVTSDKVITANKKYVARNFTYSDRQFMYTLTAADTIHTIAVVSYVAYTVEGDDTVHYAYSSQGDTTATMISK